MKAAAVLVTVELRVNAHFLRTVSSFKLGKTIFILFLFIILFVFVIGVIVGRC